ncbi:DNA repair protein SWI5 homolog isoform X2 [Synchiropus splendidus]|uniref:DNA repair protein SWI5 homolog isoform X2 n=1 Tax=Synchiropus splendidus TaxID=270530 RepID=UPI00237EC786|nr:DNA repair protein SWI5 homolog isoform X2 [Synchiropus splendidus]
MSTAAPPEPHSPTCNSTVAATDLKKVLKRTPFSKSRKVHSKFKSPLQVSEVAPVSPEEELAELERKQEQLGAEISQLEAEGYRVEELDHHIDMLHEYNDIKDIGQSLLGRIAIAVRILNPDMVHQIGDQWCCKVVGHLCSIVCRSQGNHHTRTLSPLWPGTRGLRRKLTDVIDIVRCSFFKQEICLFTGYFINNIDLCHSR